MTIEAVEQCLAEFRYGALTAPAGGRLLYRLVLESDAESVLELGFAHGTSTMYMAAALQERGSGSIMTLDRTSALTRRPNIHELSAALSLEGYVTPVLAERSYNWELKKLLEQQWEGSRTVPCFDMCFVDGAHSWYEDGLAFVLVDKLLRDDSWIVFDDVRWTYASSPTLDAEKLESYPEEERDAAQVMAIFDLLVRQHPAYDGFRVLGNYAAAHKVGREGHDGNRDAFDRALTPDVVHELAFGPLGDPRREHLAPRA
jgi:predicted O-methyltransferase YrrM